MAKLLPEYFSSEDFNIEIEEIFLTARKSSIFLELVSLKKQELTRLSLVSIKERLLYLAVRMDLSRFSLYIP
ncbi:Uncharacterised protein [Leclercia adecarboxylata]|uniref:Uncharacterized protein n=1 Tax=Leclercia adecarboxylata TaxID=83655 RepID=A0A4U9HLQ0_9ENTR|nr:Uncharacterised protein [Leclercia adecarboxylata]